MQLSDFAADAYKARVRDALATAAMALTDEEMAIIALEFSRNDVDESLSAWRLCAGNNAIRPFLRIRMIFKDAPIHTYAGLFAMSILRDWSDHTGNFSSEELQKYAKMLGVESEPSIWEDASKESNVESFSKKIKGVFMRMWDAVGGAQGVINAGSALLGNPEVGLALNAGARYLGIGTGSTGLGNSIPQLGTGGK